MARSKLQITLPEELKNKVAEAAKKNEISTSLWIEFAIKKQLEKAKNNEPIIDLGF